MKRRGFIKNTWGASLLPSLPKFTIFASTPIATSAATTLSSDVYLRAEAIVRAQKVCNIGMVEHLLQLDSIAAAELRRKLLARGIISNLRTARGMHVMIAPLRHVLAPSHRKISESIRYRFKKAKYAVEQVELTSENHFKENGLVEQSTQSEEPSHQSESTEITTCMNDHKNSIV